MDTPIIPASTPKSRFLPGLFLGIGIGFLLTITVCLFYFRQPYQPIDEAKMCYLALTKKPNDLHPQTREYLKGRLYWNAAIWIDPSWLDGWHIDFGPVDEKALSGLHFIKDASTSMEIYESALSKHPKSASKPE